MQKRNIINALALFIILNIVTEFLYCIEASSSNWCLLNGDSDGCPSIGNFLYSNSTYRSPHIVRYICVLLSDSKVVREKDAKSIFSNLQSFPDSSNLPFTFVEYYENLGTFVFEIKLQESTNENRDLYPLINGLKKISKSNFLNKSDCTKESILTDLSVFAGRGNEKIHTSGQKFQGFWNNPTFGKYEERILYSDSISHKETESLLKSSDNKNGELSLYKELDYYILDRFSRISHILQTSPVNIDILQNSSIFNALDFLKIFNQSPKNNLVMQQNNSSITQDDQELRWGMSPFYNLNLENTNYTDVAHKVLNKTTPLMTSDIKSNSIDYSGDIGTVVATAIFQGMADSSSQLPPPFGNPTSGSDAVNQIKGTEISNNISKEHFPTLTNWSYKPIPQGIKTNNNNQNQNSKPNLSISSFDSPLTSNTASSPMITSGSGLSPSAFENIDKWSKVDSQTPPIGLQLTQGGPFPEFKSPSSSPSTAEWMRRTVSRQNDNGRLFSSGNTGTTNQNSSSPLIRASRLSSTQFGYFDPANRGSKQGVTFVRMNGSVFDDPNDITSFHPESFLEKLPEEVLSNMTQQQKDKVNLINAFIGTGFDVLLQMNGVARTNSNNKSGSTKNSDGKTGSGIFSFRKLHQSDMSVRNFESLLRNIDTNQGQDTAMAYVAGCDCNRFPDGVVCPLVLSGDVSIECIGYKVWDSAQKGAPLSDIVSAIDSAVVAKAQNIVFPLRFSQDTIERNRAAPRVLRHIMRRTSKDYNILFALPTGNDGMQSVEDHVDFPCDDITGMYAFCVGSINATTGLPSDFTNIPYIATIFANGENVESFALNQQKQLFSGTGMALAQSIGTINIIQGITKNKVSIFDQLAILHSTPKKLPSRSFLNQLITNSEPAPVRQVKQSQPEVLNNSSSSSFQSKSQNSLADNQYNKSDIFTGFLNESNEDRNNTVKEEGIELNNSSFSIIDIFGDNATKQANTFEPNSITKKLNNEIRIDNPINNTILEINDVKKSSENNKNLRSEPDAGMYEKDNSSIIDHFNKYNSSDYNSISYSDDNSKKSIDKYNLKMNYSEDDILYESRNYGPEILGVVLDPPNAAEVSKFIEMSNKVADHEISYNDSEFDYINKIPPKSLCYEEETRYYSPMEMVLPVDNIEQCILACSNTLNVDFTHMVHF
ncbi:uncharacterized protein CMU_016980 [Cryptosporidium muris RN66]|uniref:subtilisin n=1 Tax=Cryptosporidium muris (strain RN66) TaxID=441375 RepID=B6ACU2_CRYMR|nr:uncharacterized protein CMU_016980 [Cryptosporidium muris RN66]EEA05946.1 hypothetical protein, conserved [Cryptosporidium muris RN66]|eukprot:XP_002140295.1 hypothetical protein [Cryptosporidium muris RN66]